MTPPDVALDPRARVLMRAGRALRLTPPQSSILADVLAAGGRAPADRVAMEFPKQYVRTTLARLPDDLAPLGLTLACEAGTVALVERETPR
jgi:hypothetical protein